MLTKQDLTERIQRTQQIIEQLVAKRQQLQDQQQAIAMTLASNHSEMIAAQAVLTTLKIAAGEQTRGDELPPRLKAALTQAPVVKFPRPTQPIGADAPLEGNSEPECR